MQNFDKVTEINTPSNNPTHIKIIMFFTLLLIPLMAYFSFQGYQNNTILELSLGLYGIVMSLVASFFMYKQLSNPDRLTITETGIIYEFLNIKFRVGWEDIEEIKFDGSKVIQIKLNSPEKVAFNSLVTQKFVARTQFNPYTKQLIKRASLFRKTWLNNTQELSTLLKEAGAENGYHIAIPFLESSETAEKAFQQISKSHTQYNPQYISPVVQAETHKEENLEPNYQTKLRQREFE